MSRSFDSAGKIPDPRGGDPSNPSKSLSSDLDGVRRGTRSRPSGPSCPAKRASEDVREANGDQTIGRSPVKRVQCQGRDNRALTTAIVTAILLIIIMITITIMVRTGNVTMVVIVQETLGKSQCHGCPCSRA